MNFGFLLFNDLEELDLVGPWELVSMWSKFAKGPEKCVMIAETEKPVTCYNGMLITPHATFQDAPQLDYLLIPGGFGTRKEVENDALNEFVKQQADTCRIVLSVCTGSFILHSAGLLNGKKATTHYLSLDRLRNLDGIDVVEERYVKNEKVWTSSGVSAGIDMTLDLIAQEAGQDAAGIVQLYAEYFPNGKVYGTPQNDPNAPGYIQAIK